MPTLYGNAAEIAAALARLQTGLPAAVAAAEEENIQDAHNELVKASSGTETTAQLRSAGYPFATRAPNDAYDPSVINDQGGGFKECWETAHPEITSDGGETVITSKVTNRDPKARFMKGTKKMVPRRVVNRAQDAIRNRRKARIKRAVRAAIQGNS